MAAFRIDVDELRAACSRAAARGRSPDATELRRRLGAGRSLDDESLVALLLSPHISTAELRQLALERRPGGPPKLETFTPLYLSNECDAECAMCGMRRSNDRLRRETADRATAEAQLQILHRRGLRGVALLSGEYRSGPRRTAMLAAIRTALRAAIAGGFEHVLINVGSLEAEEYARLLEGIPRGSDGRVRPQITMCTFQETYDPRAYARFMGADPDNPRSNFERRLCNLDRAGDAGLWSANPGLLLGLNRDLGFELLALLAHVHHLRARDMDVYVSLPRLRKASGAPHPAGVSDDDLTRLVSLLSAGVPEAKVVISTREAPEIQRRLLPLIGVLTPGSPGVAPYAEDGAVFELEASQFEVLDRRPIEAILGEILAAGATIDRYEPGRP